MKNIALSVNVCNKEETEKSTPVVIGKVGSPDFQIGVSNDGSEVVMQLDGKEFTASEMRDKGLYKNLVKLKERTYEIWYDTLDYKYANKYFHDKNPKNVANLGGCSAVRKGNYYGRLFDWTYDNLARFVVHTSNIGSRRAVTGTGNSLTGFTSDMVDSGKPNEMFNLIPFLIVDGRNSSGVIANTNVVPLDKGSNTKTVPTIETREEVCALMIVRYILDNFDSAEEAVNYISNYVSVYPYHPLDKMHYDLHVMVADKNKTFLIEFINNQNVVTEMTAGSGTHLAGKPYMTNFYLSDVTFSTIDGVAGKVYTPETSTDDHDAIRDNNITMHGDGLERYNLIVDEYDSISSKDDMKNLIYKLNYTRSYPNPIAPQTISDPYWYTEFVGNYSFGHLTVASKPEDFAPILPIIDEQFKHRSRNPKSPYYGGWYSSHTVLYDMTDGSITMVFEEDGEEFVFGVEMNITLPEPPSTDGTYNIQAVVSGGKVSYQWIQA